MPIKRITVLLAEDHHIVREGFRSLLKHERDIEVVGEAETGRQAVQLTRKLRPAVVVMDIAMPLLNGLEATRQIRKDFPEIKVLILSAHSDEAYVEQARALGASGFLLKQTSPEALAQAIRDAQQGKQIFSGAVGRRLREHSEQPASRGGRARKNCRLSPREFEVLKLVGEGKGNKAIAVELGISFKTVDRHRQQLMAKLDIHDTAGLTRYATNTGIIKRSARTGNG